MTIPSIPPGFTPHTDDSSRHGYPAGITHDTRVDVVLHGPHGMFLFEDESAQNFGWAIAPATPSAPGLRPVAAPLVAYRLRPAAPLALPSHASVCEWCTAPVPAYGPDTCTQCQTLFDDCWAAEQDFMRRLAALAGGLLWDWTRDWAHLPEDELKSAFTHPLEGMHRGVEADVAALGALFDVAYAAARCTPTGGPA